MTDLDPVRDPGSRLESAEAGVHAELDEQLRGEPVGEHVTADDVVHHHHPADPDADITARPMSRAAVSAAVLAGAVTVAGVVAAALAIGGGH